MKCKCGKLHGVADILVTDVRLWEEISPGHDMYPVCSDHAKCYVSGVMERFNSNGESDAVL